MQAQNKDVFRKQLIDSLGLFNSLKPFFDQAGLMPNPKFWIERLMESMHIRNIEEGFMPIPMPIMPPVMPGNDPVGGGLPPKAGPMPGGPPQPPEAAIMAGAQRT
jgi:hypothetical protein